MLKVIDPVSIVWIRFTVAFIILFLYSNVGKKSSSNTILKPLFSPWIILAISGLGLNYLGYNRGVDLAGPGLAQIIIQFGPILLGVAGYLFFKEKISIKQLFGLLIFLLGFIIFYRERMSFGISTHQYLKTGISWTFFGAISWTTYAIGQKILAKKFKTSHINLVIFGVCSICYFPFVNWNAVFSLTPFNLFLGFILGVNTVVAYGLVGESLRLIPANIVGVIITLNPIITLILIKLLEKSSLWGFAQENLTVQGLLGALIFIFGAVVFIYFSKKEPIMLGNSNKLGNLTNL